MTRLTLAFVLACVCHAWGQYTVETIPNQRRIDGSRVSNPDNILTAGAVTTLDTLLVDIETKTTAQVAVVAVESIGDADIFDFAQELFNTWGIGHENNNGMLVLLVTDQRTIRFHTGGGVQGILTDVTCKRIQRDYMVPSFKEGDYEAGLVAGMQRVHELLTDPSKREELVFEEAEEVSDYTGWVTFLVFFYGIPFLGIWWYKSVNRQFNSADQSRSTYKRMRLKRRTWLIEFGLIPILIVVAFAPGPADQITGWCFVTLYLYFMATLVHRLVRERKLLLEFVGEGRYYDATQFIGHTQWFWFFMALVFPLPFLFYFLFHLTRKSHYRNHPRNCKICKTKMNKLSERDEDAFLDERQQFEEKIKTVDYDVWLCPSCKATREWHYIKASGKYDSCPKCKTKAFYRKSRRTVVNATYESAGEGKEVFECKYCNESLTTTFAIAMLVASSSSDSDSSSSSSSSSSSDYGGGSSDGGGASSSW